MILVSGHDHAATAGSGSLFKDDNYSADNLFNPLVHRNRTLIIERRYLTDGIATLCKQMLVDQRARLLRVRH